MYFEKILLLPRHPQQLPQVMPTCKMWAKSVNPSCSTFCMILHGSLADNLLIMLILLSPPHLFLINVCHTSFPLYNATNQIITDKYNTENRIQPTFEKAWKSKNDSQLWYVVLAKMADSETTANSSPGLTMSSTGFRSKVLRHVVNIFAVQQLDLMVFNETIYW